MRLARAAALLATCVLATCVACGAPASTAPATRDPLGNAAPLSASRRDTGDASAVNLVPGASVGPVRLGMTRDEVHRVLGGPGTVDSAVPQDETFATRGLDIAYDKEWRVVSIHAFDGQKAGYETSPRTPFPLVGPHGLRWGSTVDDVIRAFGPPAPGKSGSLDDAPVPTRWIAYDSVMFDFVLATGALWSVAVYAPDPAP